MPDTDDEDSAEGLEAGTESKAEDAGNADPEPKRRQHFPASLGLSAFLPPGPTDGSEHVEVTVSWADHTPEEISEDRADKIKKGWKRVPRGPYTVQVPLDDDPHFAAQLDRRLMSLVAGGFVLERKSFAI